MAAVHTYQQERTAMLIATSILAFNLKESRYTSNIMNPNFYKSGRKNGFLLIYGGNVVDADWLAEFPLHDILLTRPQ